jgi:hypothetical protein
MILNSNPYKKKRAVLRLSGLIIFSFFIFCSRSFSQNKISFKLIDQREIQVEPNSITRFYGGISGIEYMNDSVIAKGVMRWGKPNVSVANHNVLLMVSDYNPAEKKSHAFQVESDYVVTAFSDFFGLRSIECIRYNKTLDELFYSYEEKSITGVASIKMDGRGMKDYELIEDSIPSKNTSENRGIEGIAFTNDNNLWLAFEAGGNTECVTESIPFLCYKLDTVTMTYDKNNFTQYEYPFNRCQCMADTQHFNGWIGNGVSEILGMKNDPNQLLVLERCFNGTKGSVKLFLATVNMETHQLSKELVFDFNDNSSFDAKDRDFSPDNLEAMTWGDDEDGHAVLYLASDNNFSKKQKNQLVKLQMIVQ